MKEKEGCGSVIGVASAEKEGCGIVIGVASAAAEEPAARPAAFALPESARLRARAKVRSFFLTVSLSDRLSNDSARGSLLFARFAARHRRQ
ncbi:MAG: hypothetical protein ACI3YC_07510, partial [Alloprevotella sp.]